jgi:tRNA-binding protein
LTGTLVVCVCNFGPKNIAGFTSELLILGAKGAAGQVIVLGPRSEVAVGQPIF